MDSLTQFVLGASIGELILGRRIGYKAALWGGVVATMPDLDVFVHRNEPDVERLILHRSWSHSLIVLTAASPIIALLIQKFHSFPKELHLRWYLMIWLALITHPLLDSLTVYGTQLLWPFTDTSFAFNTLFIIDPFYTVPMIIGLIGARCFREKKGFVINASTICFSTAYILWSIISNQIATHHVKQQLAQQGIDTQLLLITPTPLNTFLWRFIAKDDKYYHEVFYSIFDQTEQIQFESYLHKNYILKNVEQSKNIEKLKWFSKGFYKISIEEQNKSKPLMVLTDLRMGYAENYFFRFVVAEKNNTGFQSIVAYRKPRPIGLSTKALKAIKEVWQRIFDDQKKLSSIDG